MLTMWHVRANVKHGGNSGCIWYGTDGSDCVPHYKSMGVDVVVGVDNSKARLEKSAESWIY